MGAMVIRRKENIFSLNTFGSSDPPPDTKKNPIIINNTATPNTLVNPFLLSGSINLEF